MKKSALGCLVAIAIVFVLLIASGAFYTVHETEQVIITQFGEAQGEPITEPGLKFKIPMIQKVRRFDQRILEWDGDASEMPTKDKTYIAVDTYARWRIVDALVYFERLRDERSARSRLDDILDSETRNSVAKHELIEVIRTTKDRKPAVAEDIAEADLTGSVGKLIPIRRGRAALEKDIFDTSRTKLREFGIELLDVRFKRINYNQDVRDRIYERMISERQQIAERFRSEGAGEAAKILGDMERDLKEIESVAYKEVETVKGEADAKATEIYAKAFDVSEESAEFYQFLRTMEMYEDMLAGESTVVLSTDSDLFKYLKAVKPLAPSTSADAIDNPTAAPKPKARPQQGSNQ
ncbi:protease modulator HflC [Verrucomicrobiales bacterium]|nr:protease modulator HflC [Verrucomicrobiales bacterium]